MNRIVFQVSSKGLNHFSTAWFTRLGWKLDRAIGVARKKLIKDIFTGLISCSHCGMGVLKGCFWEFMVQKLLSFQKWVDVSYVEWFNERKNLQRLDSAQLEPETLRDRGGTRDRMSTLAEILLVIQMPLALDWFLSKTLLSFLAPNGPFETAGPMSPECVAKKRTLSGQ